MARLFFIGLWCQADRAGRLEDCPERLQFQICPYDVAAGKVSAATMLKELTPKFLTRYGREGKKYIQIKTFLKHQRPHHTEADSIIPPPDGDECGNKPSDNGYHLLGKEKEKEKESIKERTSAPGPGSSSRKAKGCSPICSARFDRFWAAYPRKVGKGAARKIWTKLNPSDDLILKMISSLEKQCSSSQWQKDGGQYIPHPSTWLNQERWDDEISDQERGDGIRF